MATCDGSPDIWVWQEQNELKKVSLITQADSIIINVERGCLVVKRRTTNRGVLVRLQYFISNQRAVNDWLSKQSPPPPPPPPRL